jgi:hypothetical protein
MSSFRNNVMSMNGVISLDDGGGGLLQDGILNCEGVLASDYVDAVHIRGRETLAIGNNVAVGNSIITQKIHTNSFVSNTLECKTIKVDKIEILNNLLVYNENNVGFIKKTSIITTTPLIRNLFVSVVSIPLEIGVYVLSYDMTIQVTANNTNIPLLYGLSSDGLNLDVIKNNGVFSDVIFGNTATYPIISNSMPYHVTTYGTIVSLIIRHTSTPVSNVIVNNCRITALRIG